MTYERSYPTKLSLAASLLAAAATPLLVAVELHDSRGRRRGRRRQQQKHAARSKLELTVRGGERAAGRRERRWWWGYWWWPVLCSLRWRRCMPGSGRCRSWSSVVAGRCSQAPRVFPSHRVRTDQNQWLVRTSVSPDQTRSGWTSARIELAP